MGVCNCSMFCCTLLYVHSSIAIILMGKRELVALLNLSFWCLVMVERLFLTMPWGYLRFVIVVFPDHTQLLFLILEPNNTVIKISNYNSAGQGLSIWTMSKGQAHVRFGLIAYPQKPLIITHSGVSRGTRCLKVNQSLLQLSYFVYVKSESPGEVMRTCRLVRAFATRQCNKDHHLVC